jgi:hypothetical protein
MLHIAEPRISNVARQRPLLIDVDGNEVLITDAMLASQTLCKGMVCGSLWGRQHSSRGCQPKRKQCCYGAHPSFIGTSSFKFRRFNIHLEHTLPHIVQHGIKHAARQRHLSIDVDGKRSLSSRMQNLHHRHCANELAGQQVFSAQLPALAVRIAPVTTCLTAALLPTARFAVVSSSAAFLKYVPVAQSCTVLKMCCCRVLTC